MRENTLEKWRSHVKKMQGLLSSGLHHLVLKALLDGKEYLCKGEMDVKGLIYEEDIYPILEAAQKLDEIAHEKDFRIFLSDFILRPIRKYLNEHANPDCYQKSRNYILKHLNNAEESEIKHPALFPYVAGNFYEYVHALPANPHDQLKKLRERYVNYLQQNPEVYDLCSSLHIILDYWRVLKSSGFRAEIYRESDIEPLLARIEYILLLSREENNTAQQEQKRLILLFYILLHGHCKLNALASLECPVDGFAYSLRSDIVENEKGDSFTLSPPLLKNFKDKIDECRLENKTYKSRLAKSRKVFGDRSKDIFEAQKEHTQDIIALLEDMFSEASGFLGKAPCDIEICVLGSTSRNDRRPYSDLELMILHSEPPKGMSAEDQKHWQAHVDVYIYHLAILFELMMIQLGETPKPGEINGGFRIDASTHVLLNKVWGTPIDLAQRFVTQLEVDGKSFKHAWLNPELRAMLNPLRIYLDNSSPLSLTQEYKTIVADYLNEKIQSEDNILVLTQELHLADSTFFKGLTRRQGIAIALSSEILWNSKNKIESMESNTTINIKEVYYKPLAYFARSLSLYYQLEGDSHYAIFEGMKSRCSMGAQVMLTLLQSALGFIVRQQVLLHKHYQEEVIPYRLYQNTISKNERLFCLGVDFIGKRIILPLESALADWIKSPSEGFLGVLDRLAEKSWNREFIHQWYTVCESSGISTEVISMLPDPAGFRVKERVLAEKLERGILSLYNNDWAAPLYNWPTVKIKRVTKSGTDYFDMDPRVVEAIINPETGHIKRHEKIEISPNAFKHRAVNYVEGIYLHFKEHPDRPLMSVFSHLLHMRIFGSGSIPAEVVLFEVMLKNKTKIFYPVLISLTVPGPTLESRLDNLPKLNLPRLAANLVMDAVKHTADAFARNSIIYEDSECICVDSEQIFVNSESEPGFLRGTKIQEVSIFYCLPIFREGGELGSNLPDETLNALANLNVDLVLNECLNLLSEREKYDLLVYGEHLQSFVNRSDDHRFVGEVLFEEGMIGKLALELRTLKEKARKGELTAFDVLSVCFGQTYAKQYLLPTKLVPSAHLKNVVGRAHSQSPAQFEKQCLGSSASYHNLRLRQYSIEKAREEIANYQFSSICEEGDLKADEFSAYSKELTLVLKFSGQQELDNHQLSRLIRAKICFVQLIIKNCSVLDDSNLRELLKNSGDTLKLLSISGHAKITEDTFDYLIGFPKLEALLANQTGVKNLSRLRGLRSMVLNNIKVLHLNSCSGLISIDLAAAQLLYFSCKNNEKLSEIQLRTLRLVELKLDGASRLKQGELSVSWKCSIKTAGAGIITAEGLLGCMLKIEYGVVPGSPEGVFPLKVRKCPSQHVEIVRLTKPYSLLEKLDWPENLFNIVRLDLGKLESMLASKKEMYRNATVESQDLFAKEFMLLWSKLYSNRLLCAEIFDEAFLNLKNILIEPELACIFPVSGFPIPGNIINPLIKNLKSDNSTTRAWTASILRNLRPQSSWVVAELVKALEDKDPGALKGIFSALANLPKLSPEAIGVLIGKLKNPYWRVRALAAKTLGDLNPINPKIISALIKALEDPDAEVKTQVMISFSKLKLSLPELIDPFIRALSDSDPDVRALAALTLGDSQQPFERVIDALIVSLLEDSHHVARANAATALGQLKQATPVVIAALEKGSESFSWDVADASRAALRNLKKEAKGGVAELTSKALGPLPPKIPTKKPDLKPRAPRGKETLFKVIGNYKLDRGIRTLAMFELEECGEKSPELITEIIEGLRDMMFVELEVALPFLLASMGKNSPEIIKAIIKAFNTIEDFGRQGVRSVLAKSLCLIIVEINAQSYSLIAEFSALEILIPEKVNSSSPVSPRKYSDLILQEGSPVFSRRSMDKELPESVELLPESVELFHEF